MYKRELLSVIAVFVILSISVFSASPQDTAIPSPPVDSVPVQQIADVLHTVVSEQTKNTVEDINKHIDENFGQLDKRLMDNNRTLITKLIFALLGGMTVVLVGYAYLVNRVSKQYDINFYEKMIESKVDALNSRLPSSLYMDTMYSPITFVDDRIVKRFDSPQDYFDGISHRSKSSSEVDVELYDKVKRDLIAEMKSLSKGSEKKIFNKIGRTVAPLPKGLRKKRFFQSKAFYITVMVLILLATAVYFYLKYFKKTVITGVV